MPLPPTRRPAENLSGFKDCRVRIDEPQACVPEAFKWRHIVWIICGTADAGRISRYLRINQHYVAAKSVNSGRGHSAGGLADPPPCIQGGFLQGNL